MANYITSIRTTNGDLPYDYNFLANLPQSDTTLSKSGSFADAKATGSAINNINTEIQNISVEMQNINVEIENINETTQSTDGNIDTINAAIDQLKARTINNKPLSEDIVLIASDVGAAESEHTHAADDIDNGVFDIDRIPMIPIQNGGTNANNGKDGLKNLLAAGPMILSSHQFGDTLPDAGTPGRIFFLRIK